MPRPISPGVFAVHLLNSDEPPGRKVLTVLMLLLVARQGLNVESVGFVEHVVTPESTQQPPYAVKVEPNVGTLLGVYVPPRSMFGAAPAAWVHGTT